MKSRKPGQSFHWDYNKVMKFVGLLRERPIIWDHDDPQFRNKFRRDLAYDELSFEMNTTNDRIKKKIHTMRSQYLAEYRKMQKEKNYRPLWQYFNTFKFLYKHDEDELNSERIPNNGESDCEFESLDADLTEIDTMDTCYDLDEYEDQDPDVQHEENYVTRESASIEYIEELHNEFNSPPQKQLLLPNILVHEEQANMFETKRNGKIEDEFTTLAESLASEMRLLKDHPNIQNALRLKILRAVKDAKQALQIKKLNE